jgi:hypothetical protein
MVDLVTETNAAGLVFAAKVGQFTYVVALFGLD